MLFSDGTCLPFGRRCVEVNSNLQPRFTIGENCDDSPNLFNSADLPDSVPYLSHQYDCSYSYCRFDAADDVLDVAVSLEYKGLVETSQEGSYGANFNSAYTDIVVARHELNAVTRFVEGGSNSLYVYYNAYKNGDTIGELYFSLNGQVYHISNIGDSFVFQVSGRGTSIDDPELVAYPWRWMDDGTGATLVNLPLASTDSPLWDEFAGDDVPELVDEDWFERINLHWEL